MNPYESDRLLAEYLLFHYGTPEEILPYAFGPGEALNFAVRVATDCLDRGSVPASSRALDLGCAVGRSSFELARFCGKVIGIDYSANFVRAANELRTTGAVSYLRADEGELTTLCEAKIAQDIDRRRVSFEVGDACALRDGLGQFDVALLINLVDRVKDPRACLGQLPGLIHAGGQVVIASPFTWLEDYTPKGKWLGGFLEAGGAVSSFATLQSILAPDFELTRTLDVPFLIREHARKFQWSVSKTGVWRRR